MSTTEYDADEHGDVTRAPRVSSPFVPRASAPLRRIGVIGLALAVPIVAVMTLWPTHFLLRAKPRVLQGLEWLHARELFEWVYWTRLEVLANIAMFVPLALLFVFVLGARRWWIALGLCLAATVGIEFVQHFLLPGRVASVKDIVANGIGAGFGALIAVVIESAVRRARRRSSERRLASAH